MRAERPTHVDPNRSKRQLPNKGVAKLGWGSAEQFGAFRSWPGWPMISVRLQQQIRGDQGNVTGTHTSDLVRIAARRIGMASICRKISRRSVSRLAHLLIPPSLPIRITRRSSAAAPSCVRKSGTASANTARFLRGTPDEKEAGTRGYGGRPRPQVVSHFLVARTGAAHVGRIQIALQRRGGDLYVKVAVVVLLDPRLGDGVEPFQRNRPF